MCILIAIWVVSAKFLWRWGHGSLGIGCPPACCCPCKEASRSWSGKDNSRQIFGLRDRWESICMGIGSVHASRIACDTSTKVLAFWDPAVRSPRRPVSAWLPVEVGWPHCRRRWPEEVGLRQECRHQCRVAFYNHWGVTRTCLGCWYLPGRVNKLVWLIRRYASNLLHQWYALHWTPLHNQIWKHGHLKSKFLNIVQTYFSCRVLGHDTNNMLLWTCEMFVTTIYAWASHSYTHDIFTVPGRELQDAWNMHAHSTRQGKHCKPAGCTHIMINTIYCQVHIVCVSFDDHL